MIEISISAFAWRTCDVDRPYPSPCVVSARPCRRPDDDLESPNRRRPSDDPPDGVRPTGRRPRPARTSGPAPKPVGYIKDTVFPSNVSNVPFQIPAAGVAEEAAAAADSNDGTPFLAESESAGEVR